MLKFLTTSIDVYICFETHGYFYDVEDVACCRKEDFKLKPVTSNTARREVYRDTYITFS